MSILGCQAQSPLYTLTQESNDNKSMQDIIKRRRYHGHQKNKMFFINGTWYKPRSQDGCPTLDT